MVNRILDLKSPDDPRVKILLQDQDEIEMAINMTAVLTKALMFTTQALSKKPVAADPLPGIGKFIYDVTQLGGQMFTLVRECLRMLEKQFIR